MTSRAADPLRCIDFCPNIASAAQEGDLFIYLFIFPSPFEGLNQYEKLYTMLSFLI